MSRHSNRRLAWQLADQLRLEVFKITKLPSLDADTKLRSRIDEAAASVCRHVTEAFGCDRDREFARFVRLACSSIADVQDGVRASLTKKYVTEKDVAPVREVLSRLHPALTSLLAHRAAATDDRSPSVRL